MPPFWHFAHYRGEIFDKYAIQGYNNRMIDAITNDIAIEEIVRTQFGLQVEVKQVIAREIPVSHTAAATVFLTPKHQLFALIQAQSGFTLGDAQQIGRKMGLEVDSYLPPQHNANYFDDVARQNFRKVFPGRHDVADSELRFYRLLAPYNPALLKIKAINDGVIRQFDSHDSSQWRVAAKFAYKQIQTL